MLHVLNQSEMVCTAGSTPEVSICLEHQILVPAVETHRVPPNVPCLIIAPTPSLHLDLGEVRS